MNDDAPKARQVWITTELSGRSVSITANAGTPLAEMPEMAMDGWIRFYYWPALRDDQTGVLV